MANGLQSNNIHREWDSMCACMYVYVCMSVCMYMCAYEHVYGGCEYIYIVCVFSLGKKILKGKQFEIPFSFFKY